MLIRVAAELILIMSPSTIPIVLALAQTQSILLSPSLGFRFLGFNWIRMTFPGKVQEANHYHQCVCVCVRGCLHNT